MAEQRDYGHIINPTSTRVNLKPGAKITGSFKYSNAFFAGSPEEQTFVTSVGFIYQVNGVPKVYPKTPVELSMYDMSSWVKLSDSEFTLKKGVTKEINYTIEVPNEPSAGGKYAVIIIVPKSQAQDEASPEGSGAKLNASIGFPIIGRIGGTEIINSEVVSFTSNKQIYWGWPQEPIVFTTTLKNTGNVDYLPGGNIFVHSGDITKPIYQASINPSNLVILPDNTRPFETVWEAKEPIVQLQKNGIFINFEYFRMGHFIATEKVGYDVEGKRVVATREISIWILPLPLIIAILTIILVSTLGIWLWKRRQKHQQKLVDKKNTQL